MKLSFVIPAYNEQAYIGKCLKAIQKELRGQKITSEIIVVNNGSTDKTEKIAKSYKNVRVITEKRKGLVSARSAGFKASTGELIANVDADTMLPDGWIEKVLHEFTKHKNLAILSGPYIYYDLSMILRLQIRIFYCLTYLLYLFDKHILRIGGMVQGGNYVCRRSALNQIGGYNMKYDFYGEDADLARRFQKAGEVKYTFRLPMYTSGRRLIAEGAYTMGLRYALNYFWTFLFKKPFSKSFLDIRYDITDTLRYHPQDLAWERFLGLSVLAVLLMIIFGILLFGYTFGKLFYDTFISLGVYYGGFVHF